MKTLPLWSLFALGAAASWGVWGVFNKLALSRAGWQVPFLASAAIYVTGSVLILIFNKPGAVASVSAWAFAAGAALTGTAGMLLYYAAFRGGAAPVAAVVPLTALYPAVSALLGIWVLGERLAPQQYAGVALALVAAALLASGK